MIISDSTLCNILPPQMNNMTFRYKVMCCFECFVPAKSMHSSLLTWRYSSLKHLEDKNHNVQNRRSSEISSRIFETYRNFLRPHGCHIQNTAVNMAMIKMCLCTSKHNGLLHWKCVLRCCDKCTRIVLPSQEANKDTTKTCPTIRFHVYLIVSYCNVHGRHPYN